MSGLKQTISEIASKHLPDNSHFLVDVLISEKSGKKVLNILIDGDNGVNIKTCASVSRAVSGEIEENEILEDAYILEVSSPGVDYPLGGKREYQKNIGRTLKVFLSSGSELEGVLLEVLEAGIRLNSKKKGKGRKMIEEEVILSLDEIEKSIVQVSFK